MIADLRHMRRASVFGLASLVILVIAGDASAQAQETGQNAVLLELEAPAEAVRQMRELPAQILLLAKERRAYPVAPDALDTVRASVDAAYRIEPTLEAVRAALAATPDAADAPLDPALPERMEAARSEAAKLTAGDTEEARKAIETRWQSRSDQKRITELTDLMASPEINSEIFLTASRIDPLFDRPGDKQADEFKAMSASQLDAELEKWVRSTRSAANDPSTGPFAREQALGAGKGALQTRLVLMSEADISALHAFYASPEGRAKRDALVTSFAGLNDRNAQAMLKSFLAKALP